LEAYPYNTTFTPKDILEDVNALTATLTVAVLVALLATAFLASDLATLFGSSDRILTEARNEAVQSYLLLVGFGFSAFLVVVSVWARLRISPFLEAENALKARKPATEPAAATLPWVTEETIQSLSKRRIEPLHPVLDKDWRQSELERRKEAEDAKEDRKDAEEADKWLAQLVACDEKKFAILVESTNFGGALQDIFKDAGQSRVLEIAKLAAPAALGTALSLFG
jgi:hypothetical protein